MDPLAHAARMASVELPAGARGGSRPDAWDAVWVGAMALVEGGWRAGSHGGVSGGGRP